MSPGSPSVPATPHEHNSETFLSTRFALQPLLRWAGRGLLGLSAALLVWLVFLGATLPVTVSARHWSTAWVGLDVLEAAGLALTGWLVLRRDARVAMAASATAALLVADAWLDMATSPPRLAYGEAILLAFAVELPLAIACAAVAYSAPRWCRARR